MGPEPGQSKRTRAFTLIEIMAVVLIIGLMTVTLFSQIPTGGAREVRNQARVLAGQIELARQRAVMTGDPHRLVVDIDEAGYWVEIGTFGSDAPTAPLPGSRTLDLSPPTSGQRRFEALPGQSGKGFWLPDDLVVGGIETEEGWVDGGTYAIEFDPDGATEGVSIIVRSERAGIALDVHPLLDSVRIRDEGA